MRVQVPSNFTNRKQGVRILLCCSTVSLLNLSVFKTVHAEEAKVSLCHTFCRDNAVVHILKSVVFAVGVRVAVPLAAGGEPHVDSTGAYLLCAGLTLMTS